MTIRVSTSSSGGKTLKKKVTVITDDPKNEQIPLTITGRVVGIYTLSPKSVKLRGVVGETIRETVRLIPSREYPFTVKEVTAKKGQNIRFQLEEIKDGEDVGYELTVENISTSQGAYFDTLYLKTSSKLKPEIQILVTGSIRAAADETAGKKDGPDATGAL